MENITLETIHKDLEYLKKIVEEMREKMIDSDHFLTYEEEERLNRGIEEFREGNTISHEELKKELGL